MNLKKPQDCVTLEEVRNQIDMIDHEIILLFGIRHQYVEEIVRFKNDKDSVIAQERKDQVIRQRKEWAIQEGLNGSTFEKMFTLLVESNIRHEMDLLRKVSKKQEK